MVAIVKYIPANEEHEFNTICDEEKWYAPECPSCINDMEVCAMRCTKCGGEWRDANGVMTRRHDKT